jgi:protein-L-isoaspartate(D-aspartate) O-methyltransferase
VPEPAPFEAIAVAASATEVPPALVEQLAEDGRLVLPLRETLVRVRRAPDGHVTEPLVPARFVPLVTGFRPT